MGHVRLDDVVCRGGGGVNLKSVDNEDEVWLRWGSERGEEVGERGLEVEGVEELEDECEEGEGEGFGEGEGRRFVLNMDD